MDESSSVVYICTFHNDDSCFLDPRYKVIHRLCINVLLYLHDSVRHDTNLAETEEEEKKIEMEETPPAKTFRDYSRKIEPLIRQWVESEHFLRPSLTIREVANEMGTNHNYLSTYLNQVMDISFTTWLNTLRVEKSKEYLASEERFSIEECGAKVGIPESYNFSRWFKIVTGMSPGQYRKSLRSK